MIVVDQINNIKINSNKINYNKIQNQLLSEGQTFFYIKDEYEIESYDVKL